MQLVFTTYMQNQTFDIKESSMTRVVTRVGNELLHKLTSVFFHASFLVIDHEFRHNIVKVAVDPEDDS